jgi:tetratricopeptide (TPR) repeat protein
LLSDPPPQASAVLIALYQRPWRILHVCAHGEFALRNVEGVELTGVLMSDGQMLTAVEIRAMELVPELVFLNCCHLGQASVPAGQGQVNLLAASMARELIAVGVRCVVVAGWAVSDAPAMCFGKTFYEKLLGPDGLPFGEAIFRAREATSELAPKDITWGAYQAYGDPGWRAHPQAGSSAERERPKFVAQEELLNALARLRVDATRRARRHPLTPDGREAQRKAVDDLLAQRCEPSWAALPEVQGALGETWFALGEFERAQACFKVAIRGEQDKGVVPIRHIELLANALARRAQQVVEQGDPKAADQLLDEAVKKLELLDQIAADGRGSTPERGALKGSALKRRAELLAREADVDKHLVRESIRSAIRAYIKAGKKPYPRLNALALAALVCKPSTCAGLARRARACGKAARLDSQREPSDAWNMVLTTDACMVELLLSPTEPTPGKERSARDAYQHALSAVPLSPMQLDSMRTHMDLLTLLARALDRPELVDRLCLLRTMV